MTLAHASLLLTLLLLAACVRDYRDLSSVKRERVLRWTVDAVAESSDWTRCATPACRRHAALAGEGLTRVTVDNGDIGVSPGAASAWTQESPLSWRFTLRPQARWSDGATLKAADFRESWVKVLRSCREITEAAWLFAVKGAQALCEAKGTDADLGVLATEDNAVVVTLTRPEPLLPRLLSHPVFAPRRESAFSGPFVPDLASSGEARRLYRRNPAYWRHLELDAVSLTSVPSPARRLQHWFDGQVDLLDEIPDGMPLPAEAAAIDSDAIVVLTFPTTRKPLSQSEARATLAAAVDRAELARLARGTWAPTAGLSLTTKSGGAFAPESAAKAWTAFHLDRFSLAWPSDSGLQEIALNLQAQFAKTLGARVDVPGGKRKPAATHAGVFAVPPPPATLTIRTLPLDVYAPRKTLEPLVPFFSDASARGKFEGALTEAADAATLDDLAKALAKAEKIAVEEESVVMPLLRRQLRVLRSTRVRGLVRDGAGGWDMTAVAVD